MYKHFRGVVIAAMVVMLAVVGVGCSSPEDDAKGGQVQINLPDGRQVTLDGAPKRIVTLGGQWTDIALSFGVTPVGYFDSIQAQTKTLPPWYGDKLKDATLIDPTGDVVGAVGKLNPDLILAPGFASMSGNFDSLAKLAPTIDKISGEQIDPWQDMVTLMGTILHEPEKAKQIIAGVDSKIGDILKEFPGLRDKTYAFAYMYGPDQISAFGAANDGAGKLFSSLGLKVAPKLADQSAKTREPRFSISAENIPWLNADLLVMAAQTPELQKRLEGLPGYRNLDSVRSGAVALLSPTAITGLNEPSPNSIEYSFEQMKPALAAAGQS